MWPGDRRQLSILVLEVSLIELILGLVLLKDRNEGAEVVQAFEPEEAPHHHP
jgi:hypothetical protein